MRLAPKFTRKLASPAITIGSDKITLTGSAGYRSAIATSLKAHSSLYFEAQLENDEGYARIGIATTQSELNGPIGMDEFGYSYGNKNGYGFHRSRRVVFGERFSKTDILSVYFYKGKKDAMTLEFFINGNRLNRKFENVDPGEYWPAVSLYGNCCVSFNFGAYFAYETKIVSETQKLLEDQAKAGKK